MGPLNIRPGDKLIKNYYDVLHQHSQLEIDHEGALRRAFHACSTDMAGTWKLYSVMQAFHCVRRQLF